MKINQPVYVIVDQEDCAVMDADGEVYQSLSHEQADQWRMTYLHHPDDYRVANVILTEIGTDTVTATPISIASTNISIFPTKPHM